MKTTHICPTCKRDDQWGLDAWGNVWCYCEMCVECFLLGEHAPECKYYEEEEDSSHGENT